MRTSSLMILAGGIVACMTTKWSDLRSGSTLGDIYRKAIAGQIRSTWYSSTTALASLILIVAGTYLAIIGD